MRRPVAGRAAAVLAAVLAACGGGVPAPSAMDPVSAEEAAELARAFEAAVEPVCDGAKLGALLDGENIVRRASQAAKVRAGERAQVYQGMRSVLDAFGDSLCQGFPPDMSWELLRIRDRAGRRTPVFRVVAAKGVNYHELELGKSKQDHVVRIVDLYVYVSGERLSDTFANMATEGVASVHDGDDPIELDAIMAAQRRGDGDEVRRLIALLPPRVRDTKQLRIIELQTLGTEHPDYLPALERFEQAFPDDPAVDLVSLDAHFMRKDIPELLEAIDRLDRRVGGDPYLSLMRANGYMLEPTPDNLGLAEAAARAAVAGVPDLEAVYWTLATVQVRRGDRAGAVATLERIDDRFGDKLDPATVDGDAAWQTFLASPEYLAWAGAH